jgi:hypothetical protein
VLKLLATLDSPWQIGAAGFETRVPLTSGALSGTVVYKVHTVGWSESRMRFLASVTVWPRRAAKRRLGADAEKKWRAACTRALRAHGYRGKWRASPWGLFADYWKSLKDLRALHAEVAVHNQWSRTPPW